MPGQHAWRSARTIFLWTTAVTVGIALVGLASIVVSGLLIRGVETANGGSRAAEKRSQIGDYFGGVSAVFSGVALLLLIATLLLQQRELRMQRQELAHQREELSASRAELHRSAEADMRALHVQLTEMVMNNPDLAEVWDDLPRESTTELRQNLFSNLTFNHYVLALSWGTFTEEDLVVYASSLLSSPTFLRYWNATREHKSQLPADSAEGRMFRVFERALADQRRGAPPSTA
ncbi:DUF6082 family protein [Streptomyces sp. NRRL B-1347]|uniref:DUF6082 family protein n=1 Tax=Streptomyces sp. NRRL B-1347 TaxID=1476877 RepID=UPI000ADB877E|nr:DUF6082 family protein [Streptomyces sp. NRRL B-1347]